MTPTVAEKDLLKGERDLLLHHLSEAATEAFLSLDTITDLTKIVSERNSSSEHAVSALTAERANHLVKDKELTEQYEHAAEQIFQLTSELNKTGEELVDSLKANAELDNHVLVLKNAIFVERESMEKERIALIAALNGIDSLTAQVADLKNVNVERDLALQRIKDLESALVEKESALVEKGSSYKDKIEGLKNEAVHVRDELQEAKERSEVQRLLISRLEGEIVKVEERHRDQIELIDHLQNELEETDLKGEYLYVIEYLYSQS